MANDWCGDAGLQWLAPALLLLMSAVPCLAADLAPKEMAPKHAASNPLADSEKVLMQGRADDAIAKLHAMIAVNPRDGRAHLLLCRAFYAEELADQAISECETVLSTLSSDSKAQDWMGRAYGMKASRSGPIAGFKLASRVRVAFETAVELDPRNDDAVNDLSEYYIGAPALVGGGVDKALALATRVESQLPQTAHRIRALAAEKQHDPDTAEREFKAAVGEGGSPDAWFDLGHFYYRRGQKDQALEALHHAIDADRARGPALVDVASVLVEMHTEPEIAERALRDYLASNAKTDAAPAFKAYVNLGNLLESTGDTQGAQTQFQDALALARDYPPAKKAIHHL
jgi:tetratricopeptide (TPR) repeat protein